MALPADGSRDGHPFWMCADLPAAVFQWMLCVQQANVCNSDLLWLRAEDRKFFQVSNHFQLSLALPLKFREWSSSQLAPRI